MPPRRVRVSLARTGTTRPNRSLPSKVEAATFISVSRAARSRSLSAKPAAAPWWCARLGSRVRGRRHARLLQGRRPDILAGVWRSIGRLGALCPRRSSPTAKGRCTLGVAGRRSRLPASAVSCASAGASASRVRRRPSCSSSVCRVSRDELRPGRGFANYVDFRVHLGAIGGEHHHADQTGVCAQLQHLREQGGEVDGGHPVGIRGAQPPAPTSPPRRSPARRCRLARRVRPALCARRPGALSGRDKRSACRRPSACVLPSQGELEALHDYHLLGCR